MKILKNLIYIYQSEHYDKVRFLKFIYKNLFWYKLAQRGDLDWTLRAKLIFWIVVIVWLVFIGIAISAIYLKIWFLLLLIIPMYFVLPFIVLFADVIIMPAVKYKKQKILNQATKIINGLKEKGLITIGVTGSYGKTGTKDALEVVLSEIKKVYKTPGNINTDIGIAQLIVKNRSVIEQSDVFIVEMSAYSIGEIASSCGIIQPDYSITTAIGNVHIERFGSFENIIKTKFELANATKKLAILNACNAIIKKNYIKYLRSTLNYLPICVSNHDVNMKYKDNFEGIFFTYDNNMFDTKMIAPYTVEMLIPIIKVAFEIGLTVKEIAQGISHTKQASHRLEVIHNKKLHRTIIDDSYNGNYDGFIAGVNVLSRAKGRKIVLTPGIVELGDIEEETHKKLAELYMKKLDLVLLIKNKNTQYIKKEFEANGFDKYKMYDSAEETHIDLANVLQYNDTILFQNDLTDNYN